MQDDYSYERKHKRRSQRANGSSVVLVLIAVNVALWLINKFFFGNDNLLTNELLLNSESFGDPTQWYRFLTYGFAHSPLTLWHIVFNMLMLLMFGYGLMLSVGPGGFGFDRGENVENRLGAKEFVAFYFLTIIIGGIVFALTNLEAKSAGVLGASGGVCGVVILYAWLYPRKSLLFWGILPMPMWAIGVMIVVFDALGAAGTFGGGIAYSVHLVGAACGTIYYFLVLKQGTSLTGWLEMSEKSQPSAREPSQRKFQVHIHTQDTIHTRKTPPSPEDDFNRRLDEILKRYGEVGESGLTTEEREFLKQASRKFEKK